MTSFSSLEPPSPPQLACEGSIGPYHHPPVTFGASTELKKNELLEKLLEINKILQGEKDIFSQHLSEDFLRLESKLSNLTLFYNFISVRNHPFFAFSSIILFLTISVNETPSRCSSRTGLFLCPSRRARFAYFLFPRTQSTLHLCKCVQAMGAMEQ